MAGPPTGFLSEKSVWELRQEVFWPKNPYGRSAKRFFCRKIRMGAPPTGFLVRKIRMAGPPTGFLIRKIRMAGPPSGFIGRIP